MRNVDAQSEQNRQIAIEDTHAAHAVASHLQQIAVATQTESRLEQLNRLSARNCCPGTRKIPEGNFLAKPTFLG